MKENDFLLNTIANPNFTIQNFNAVGLNASNTGMSNSEGDYKKNPLIQETFKKEDGSFDDSKFHNYYTNTIKAYNNFVTQDSSKDILSQATFHRDSIFTPISQRRLGSDTKLAKLPNPDRLNISTTILGKRNPATKTPDEIAQGQRVLLNPKAVERGATPEWGEAPGLGIFSSGFWDNLWDTLVMALWDYDADENGNKTSDPDKIVYHKGDYKLNDEGTYYYEALDGRDIYGKQVLNKSNILTAEDSWINKYDFFDSDDMNQKSGVGTVMKQLALVGSMFIPYVGPALAGLSVVKLATGLFATFGKMLTGSDSPTLSAIEGWVESSKFGNSKTKEALQDPWCWESFIGMIGDTIGQVREQRVLFQYAPAIFKGKYGMSEEGKAKLEQELLAKFEKQSATPLKLIIETGDKAKLFKAAKEFEVINNLKAQQGLSEYMESYNKIGEVLGKLYMTGVTVGGTYGEAKAQGASDIEATMLTLGYGAAEAALLNTGIGEWLYPELRNEGLHQKAIADALIDAKELTKLAELALANQTTKLGEKEVKKNLVKRLFNLGRNTARDLWSGARSTGEMTVKNAAANALGEGTEEVSEEILQDLSKGCFNLVNYLRGDDTHLSTNWRDLEGNWTISDALNDYSLNFLGGFAGGGMAGLSIDNVNYMKSIKNMDKNQAMQELIYMVRNGKLGDFIKAVDKMRLGNKDLSTTPIISDDGSVDWQPSDGTKMNQDLAVKKAIKMQVGLIEDILNSNGINMSDDSFLKGQTDVIKDLKFTYLQHSATAGRFLQEFNNLSADIIELTTELNNSGIQKTDTLQRKEKVENDNTPKEAQLDEKGKKELEERLKEKLEQKDALLKGERSAEFIGDALFELTPMISSSFIAPTFNRWVEYKTKRKVTELSPEELAKQKEAYKNWVNTEKKDDVHTTAQIFYDMVTKASGVMTKHAEDYIAMGNDPVVTRLTQMLSHSYSRDILNHTDEIEDSSDWLLQAQTKLSNEYKILGSELLNMFGSAPEIAAFQNLLTLENNVISDESISEDEKKNRLEEYERLIKDHITTIAANNIHAILDPFYKQGFVNSEVKIQLKKLLDTIDSKYLREERKIDGKLQEDLFQHLLTPELKAEFATQLTDIRAKRNEIPGFKDQLDALNHTPIEKNLNEFSLSILGKPTNVTELLAKINNELSEHTKDILNYKQDGELGDEINEALKLIDLYRVALQSMRTDNGDLDNIVGYAHTINEVNTSLGTEGYIPIAEIDKSVTDVAFLDLYLLRNKLEFAKKLNALIQGQKLSKQNRVAHNKALIYYKRLKDFVGVNIPDDWAGKDKLQSDIAGLKTLDKYISAEKNLDISKEDLENFEKESIAMGDALYNFFKANPDALTNSDKLKELVKGCNLFDSQTEILTEETELIDDHSFLSWLATTASVKTSLFYKQYADIVKLLLGSSNPMAPIATQELAIQTNYASVINGNVFSTFGDAIKKASIDKWNSLNDTEKEAVIIGNNIVKNHAEYKEFYEDVLKDNLDKILTILPSLRYSNIIFTQGVPGSGKTQAVDVVTLAIILKFHPDSKLLDNVAVVHGADKNTERTSGNKLAEDIGLEPTKCTVLTVDELCNNITPEYKKPLKEGKYFDVDSSILEPDKYGQIKSKVPIVETSTPYSLIIIDELSNIDAITLDNIDRYCKKYGITTIASGDLEQSGITGKYKSTMSKKGTTKDTISLYSVNFLGAPRLGVSMRTANSQKTRNNLVLQEFIKDTNKPIELKYFEDESGIYGDKLFDFIQSGENTSEDWLLHKDDEGNKKEKETSLLDSIKLLKQSLEEGGDLKKSIDLMLSTLKDGEKIGYVFSKLHSLSSPLYKYLSQPGIKEKIEFLEGTSSQGKEGQYYIIEPDPLVGEYDINKKTYNHGTSEDFRKDFYTSLTRSKQGSLIVFTGYKLLMQANDVYYSITPKPETSTIDEGLNKEQVVKFANRQISIWNKILPEGDADIEYKKRSQEKSELPITGSDEHSGTGTDSPAADGVPSEGETIPPSGTEGGETPPASPVDSELLDAINNNPDIVPGKTFWRKAPIGWIKSEVVEIARQGGINTTILVKFKDLNNPYNIVYYPLSLYKDYVNLGSVVYSEPSIPLPPPPAAPQLSNPAAQAVVQSSETDTGTDEEKQAETFTGSAPKSEVIVEGNKASLKILGYSFNTFGLGVKINPDNGEPLIEEDNDGKARHEKRIDSINGLMKIGKIKKVLEYITILGEIRAACYSINDRATLSQKISEILSHHYRGEGIDFNNLSVDFLFKSTARPGQDAEGNYKSKWGHQNVDDFCKFDEDITEETLFIHSSAERGGEMARKKIILQVSTETGNILEVPLMSISNPISIIDNMRINGGELEVIDLFDQATNEFYTNNIKRCCRFIMLMKGTQKDSILQLCDDIIANPSKASTLNKKIISELDSIPDSQLSAKYKDLIDLFKLYLTTDNHIFSIGDSNWTLSGNLKNIGPQIIARETAGEYEVQGFLNEAEFADISKLKVDPRTGLINTSMKISGIMYSERGFIQKPDGNFVTNKDGSPYIIQPGHPFILVSYGDIKSTDLSTYYKNQLIDPEHYPPLVKLVYVVAPGVSVELYIDNLEATATKSDPHAMDNLGNDFTSYRVVNELFKSQEFLDWALNNVKNWDKISPKIKEILANLNSYEIETDDVSQKARMYQDQLDILKQAQTIDGIDTKGVPVQTRKLFQYLLRNITYPLNSFNKGVRKNEVFDIISRALQGTKVETIRYTSDKGATILYDGPFIKIPTNSDYTITNYKGQKYAYQAYSLVDSDMFELDAGTFLNSLKEVSRKQEFNYIHNQYNIANPLRKVITTTQNDLKIKDFLNKFPEELKSRVKSVLDSSLTQNQKASEICSLVNATDNMRAFVDNGKVKMYENIPEELKRFNNYNGGGQTIEFLDNETGEVIIGTYDPISNSVEFLLELNEVVHTESIKLIDPSFELGYRTALVSLSAMCENVENPESVEINTLMKAVASELSSIAETPDGVDTLRTLLESDGVQDAIIDDIIDRIQNINQQEESQKTKCEVKTYKFKLK